MKRFLFLLACLAMTGLLSAQHCDSIDNHMAGYYALLPQNTIQLEDGTLLNLAYQHIIEGNNLIPYLTKFYKISRHDAIILDSVAIENSDYNQILLARIHDEDSADYKGFCNVLVRLEFDEELPKTDLKILFFNDDVQFCDTAEVVVPLSDTIVTKGSFHSKALLDSWNDLIIHYDIPSRNEVHFVRIGLDGVIKNEAVYPDSIIPVNHPENIVGWQSKGLTQSSVSPLGYNFFGSSYYPAYFKGFELDSLLQIVNVYNISPSNPSHYPMITNDGGVDGMISLGDGTILVVRNVTFDGQGVQGIGVVKYDTIGHAKKKRWFKPSSEPYGTNSFYGDGLYRNEKGDVYFSFDFSYRTNIQYIVVAKMDENLNVAWERYGMKKYQGNFTRRPTEMKLLDDGGVAVFGYNQGFKEYNYASNPSGLFMMLLDEEGNVSSPEIEGFFRPYLFYPNPVDNQLHIQYSPDVTPKAVELYDLQGRLLSTQSSDLENIDMKHLSTGAYTMHLIMKDGKTYSDKVVKK